MFLSTSSTENAFVAPNHMQINQTPFAYLGALHPGTFYPWNKAEENSIHGTFNSGNYKEAFHRWTVLHFTQQDLTPEEHSVLSTGEHSSWKHSTRKHSIRGTFHQEHSTLSTEGEHSMVEYVTWEHSIQGTFHREHSTFSAEEHSMQEHSVVEYSTWEHSIGEPQHRETFQLGIFNLGHRKPIDIPRGTLHPFARGTFHRGIFNSRKNHLGNMPPFHMEIFHISLNRTKQK